MAKKFLSLGGLRSIEQLLSPLERLFQEIFYHIDDSNINVGAGIKQSKLENVCARAYVSVAGQTINNITETKVALSLESYDVGSNFDSDTNYRFVAPKAGYYLIIVKAQLATGVDAKFFSVRVKKDGTIVFRATVHCSVAAQVDCAISDILSLAKDEYIEVYVYHNMGSPEDITGQTYMCVKLIG